MLPPHNFGHARTPAPSTRPGGTLPPTITDVLGLHEPDVALQWWAVREQDRDHPPDQGAAVISADCRTDSWDNCGDYNSRSYETLSREGRR
jgi:hypothetical protein